MNLVLLIWVALAMCGYLIGRDKGRAGEGFAWGFLLGVIGLIVIACRKPRQVIADGRTAFPPPDPRRRVG